MAENRYTEQDWNEIRRKFANSSMADVDIASLGDNAGINWPVKDEDDTPANYLPLSWDELKYHPNLAQGGRVDKLIDILKETLAFDTGFGEMVEAADASAEEDDDIERTLKKLEIEPDYPVSLTNLTRETQEFCRTEGLKNLGDFVGLSRKMAKNIVIGGDFRELLNALSEENQEKIAKYIPLRVGARGLHLEEALGLIADGLDKDQKAALAKAYNLRPVRPLPKKSSLNAAEIANLERGVDRTVAVFFEHFPDDRDRLEKIATDEDALQAAFDPLRDPLNAQFGAAFARKAFTGEAAPKRGLFGTIKSLFGG